MKNLIFLLILFLSAVLNNNSFAKQFEFGIGFTLEHPRDVQYDFQSSITLDKFYIPVTIDSSIRITTEFAYWEEKYDLKNWGTGTKEDRFSVFQAGLGFYYLIYFENTKIYFGPRYAIVEMKTPSTPVLYEISEKTDRIYALTFGSEYAILEKLNIGFEIQYNYYEINPWTNYGDEKTSIQKALETVFVFTFHL